MLHDSKILPISDGFIAGWCHFITKLPTRNAANKIVPTMGTVRQFFIIVQ